MKIYIATDLCGTYVFKERPKLLYNTKHYFWYGQKFPNDIQKFIKELLPDGFKQRGEKCTEINIEIIL